MDWLAGRVDELSKAASELTVYDIKSAVNKAKAYALNLTEYEQKVREATNDDPWGASSTLMQEIAQGTFNFQLFNEIMPSIYSRFTEKEARQWRQIYKGLVLLEYLVKNGSERVIDDARSHLSLIRVLRNFHYIDENGKDQGINVRNRAKEVGELLSDLDRVRMERRKAKANRNKYTGVGNDGYGGGGPSFTSASGSRYGGFGSDSFNSGGGGRDGFSAGGSGGFHDSRPSNNDFEEYDAGDDDDRTARTSAHASISSARVSTRTAPAVKAVSEPKLAPAPAVNLFDFDDDDEEQPMPPPKVAPTPPATLGNMGSAADDDFDDFQSATPSTVPAARAVSPSASIGAGPSHNLFDLLKSQGTTNAMSSPVYASQPARPASLVPLQASFSQPHAPSLSTAAIRPSPSIATATVPTSGPKAAADFSDLFEAFGSSNTPATGKPAVGTQTMAQIAAQKRQDQLFSVGGGSNANVASTASTGGADGWDSLL
ncbi:hypothetical protein JCM11641_004646 [Rhodosporidiobolus odoratus]